MIRKLSADEAAQYFADAAGLQNTIAGLELGQVYAVQRLEGRNRHGMSVLLQNAARMVGRRLVFSHRYSSINEVVFYVMER